MNVQNNEVADAYSYATKAIEDLETEKNSPKQQDPAVAKSTLDSVTASEAKSNLANVESSQQPPKQQLAHKDLTFEFNLKSIYLSIYKGDRKPESALGRFELVKLTVYGEILADTTLWINCFVSDLRLDDIRLFRKDTGIRTMLAKS